MHTEDWFDVGWDAYQEGGGSAELLPPRNDMEAQPALTARSAARIQPAIHLATTTPCLARSVRHPKTLSNRAAKRSLAPPRSYSAMSSVLASTCGAS